MGFGIWHTSSVRFHFSICYCFYGAHKYKTEADDVKIKQLFGQLKIIVIIFWIGNFFLNRVLCE
jgi:bacteriorhodopsin